MSRARSVPSRPEPVAAARSEAVLVAAGAVPLSAAVLLAAGLLPSGARIALAAAVVVIGVRVLALDGTTVGARIGAPVARGLGTAVVAVGGVLAIGALVAIVAGGELEVEEGWFGARLDGPEAAVLGALVVVLGAALGRVARGGAASPSRVAVGTATVLAGSGAAVAVLGVAGPGAVGLGDGAWRVVVTVVGAVGASVAVRVPARPWARAAGVGAGVLVAVTWGEASGVSGAVAGTLLPIDPGETAEGLTGALLVVVAGTAVVLLVTGLRRGDALLAAPAVAVLLDARAVEPGVGQVAALVVPAAVLAAGVAGLAGRGPVARTVAPAVVAAAVVGGLVAYYGAVHQLPEATLLDMEDLERTDGGLVRFALVALVLLAGCAVAAWRAAPEDRGASAIVAILGFTAVQPILLFSQAARGTVLGDTGTIAVLGGLTIAAAGVVARSRPTPTVLAAFGLATAAAVTGTGYGIAFADVVERGTLLALATFGPVLLVLLAAAAVALTGAPRRVPAAQGFGAGLAFGTTVAVLSTAGLLVGSLDGSDGPAPAVVADGGAVVSVGLLLAWIAGTGLLAASAARRASGPVAAVVVLATATAAVATAAVGAAIAGGNTGELQGSGVQALDLALGFGTSGGALDLAPGAWPVLLAVLGATLVGAGAWLGSRTPLPPDAPVG